MNARASVLAACNPRFGRYDKSKSFAANVNIPPPLLSRFDLFFTLIDEADEVRDRAVFDHIVSSRGPSMSVASVEFFPYLELVPGACACVASSAEARESGLCADKEEAEKDRGKPWETHTTRLTADHT